MVEERRWTNLPLGEADAFRGRRMPSKKPIPGDRLTPGQKPALLASMRVGLRRVSGVGSWALRSAFRPEKASYREIENYPEKMHGADLALEIQSGITSIA